jgi:hypothetical protein
MSLVLSGRAAAHHRTRRGRSPWCITPACGVSVPVSNHEDLLELMGTLWAEMTMTEHELNEWTGALRSRNLEAAEKVLTALAAEDPGDIPSPQRFCRDYSAEMRSRAMARAEVVPLFRKPACPDCSGAQVVWVNDSDCRPCAACNLDGYEEWRDRAYAPKVDRPSALTPGEIEARATFLAEWRAHREGGAHHALMGDLGDLPAPRTAAQGLDEAIDRMRQRHSWMGLALGPTQGDDVVDDVEPAF